MTALNILINYYNETNYQTVYHDVAQSILKNIYSLLGKSIYDWADICNVSTSTISRFSKKMGYRNFNEFRSELDKTVNNFSILDQLVPMNMKSSFKNPFEAYSSLLYDQLSNFFKEYNDEIFSDLADYIYKFENIRIYTHGVDINQLVLQSSLILTGKLVKSIRFETDQLIDTDNLISEGISDTNSLVILTKPNVAEKNLTIDILKKLNDNNISVLLFTNSKSSDYIQYSSKHYAFNGYMTQLDDPVFFLLITALTIKYRERFLI